MTTDDLRARYRDARNTLASRLGIRPCRIREILAAQPEHGGRGLRSYLSTAEMMLALEVEDLEARVDPWSLRSFRRGLERERE